MRFPSFPDVFFAHLLFSVDLFMWIVSTIRLLIKLQVKSVGFCISGSTSRANGNVTVVCKAMHSSAFLGWLSTSHQQQQNQYKMISEKH